MRYTGPRIKIMRALGVELPGLSRKSIENKPYPPGQHGQKQKRKSDFGTKLQEKQKLRYNYGLSERQMRRVMTDARRMSGNSGERLLELLERRLDNLVFRAGFAPTLIAARQLVSHGHTMLNGRRVTIPSIRIRPGDEVTIKSSTRNNPHVAESLSAPALQRPEWVDFDEANARARVTRTPDASEVPFPIDVQRVVEYYANRL